MHAHRRQLLVKALTLLDLSVLGSAILLGVVAYSGRVNFSLGEALALRMKVSNFVLVAAVLGMSHRVLRANGLYESRRLSTRWAECGDILKAVTFCALILSVVAVAFRIEVISSRTFFVVFWSVSVVALIASRIVLRKVLANLRRRGWNLRQVMIVGTNRRAAQMAHRIQSRPELGYELLGFADDPWPGLRAFEGMGYTVVTDLAHLPQFLRERVVDEVIIGLPLKSQYGRIREIVEQCEVQGIIVRLLGRIFDLRVARTVAESFEDETVVSVYAGQMEGWPVVVKRALDVAGSLTLLILLAPLFLLTAAVIKSTSPGPVFFAQERVGINKRRFRVLKFRTMVVDAEQQQLTLEALNEAAGPVFKMLNDPRVTPLGRFLRTTSIDELPQLFNVLWGNMSLVGPRPLPVRDYSGFDQDWHRRRFSVRPGITCLWQVLGRSRLSFDRWMELDMQYIDQWSLWLDFKILMKTLPAVFKGIGAV